VKLKLIDTEMYTNVRDLHLEAMRAFDSLRLNDGFDRLRIKESREVSDIILDKLEQLQNPPDCASANYLFCAPFVKPDGVPMCGWGCMVHHAVYCFMAAYGTNRTLILDEQIFR
jgi:glycoprotein 6-alpha-L-fucosyltransferase